MAYNSYYPATYTPNYYNNPNVNPYYQQMQNQMMQNQMQNQSVANTNQTQMQQPTIQQSGFVLVQSEQEARAYPVAPGNSVTFKDERQPYCYVKTMGFNQLDRPTFERYRLVKEDAPDAAESPTTAAHGREGKDIAYALKTDVEALRGELEALKANVTAQLEKKAVKVKKAEVTDDE